MTKCGDGANMTTMTNDDNYGDTAIATDREDGGSNDCVHHLEQQSIDNKRNQMMRWV
jgi:hypothetical protein